MKSLRELPALMFEAIFGPIPVNGLSSNSRSLLLGRGREPDLRRLADGNSNHFGIGISATHDALLLQRARPLSDPLLVRKEVCELRDRFSRCQ